MDGSPFTDYYVRARLVAKGFENVTGVGAEWMRCTLADVQTAITDECHDRPAGLREFRADG